MFHICINEDGDKLSIPKFLGINNTQGWILYSVCHIVVCSGYTSFQRCCLSWCLKVSVKMQLLKVPQSNSWSCSDSFCTQSLFIYNKHCCTICLMERVCDGTAWFVPNRNLCVVKDLPFTVFLMPFLLAQRCASMVISHRRVCLSITRQYCIKTAKRRITQTMPHDNPGVVFWRQ